MALTGNGATVAHAGIAFAANVISVDAWQNTKGSVDISHLGTTNYMAKLPADLAEAGDITITVELPTTTGDEIEAALVGGTTGLLTVDTVAGPVYTCTAFLSAVGCDGIANNERITATLTFTPDGVTTEPTWADT